MEVLAAIFLFSFIVFICFGVIALLFKAISAIFENWLLEDVCEIATKICLLVLVICGTVTIISCVLFIAFGFISFQSLEVSE